MNRFYVCVPYYSLPEFPESCNVVRIRGILPRDTLLSNPRNKTHREIGFQYDPAIDIGQYGVCQPNTRFGLKKRLDLYDELYLIFRTRYVRLDKSSSVLVTGFFEVDKKATASESNGVIHANRMHFVSVDDALNVTEKMYQSGAHRSAPTSENRDWSAVLQQWYEHLERQTNRIGSYKLLGSALKKAFKCNEFKNERYSECESCRHVVGRRAVCPLIHRQNTWKITDGSKYYNVIYPT